MGERKNERLKIVKVFWRDARFVQSEVTKQELKGYGIPIGMVVGFLVEENKESIKIAAVHLCPSSSKLDPDEPTFRAIWVIPRSQVDKIIELEEKKE